MELNVTIGLKLKEWLGCKEIYPCGKYEDNKLICHITCNVNDDHTCCFFCSKEHHKSYNCEGERRVLPEGVDITIQIMLFKMEGS